MVNCSDKGNNLEVAAGKTGGFFSPVFYTPTSTAITVHYEASSLSLTESGRKAYIAVVGKDATSLDTSNYENFQYHDESKQEQTYSYRTWSKTSLSINGSQKVSAAFNGGRTLFNYAAYVRKCKVEYK